MWVEMVVCGLHLPPLVTFEFGSMQLDNYVMYRGESVLCFVNTLRLCASPLHTTMTRHPVPETCLHACSQSRTAACCVRGLLS